MKVAAAMMEVPYETARGWKRKAAIDGDDWDRSRDANRLTKGGVKDLTANILEQLSTTFVATIEELNSAKKISPLDKAQAIAGLADALQKTVKAVGDSNPKLNKLSVAMDVLQRLSEYLREHHPELFKPFTQVLAAFGKEIAVAYRK